MKRVLVTALLLLCGLLAAFADGRVYVLCYHTFLGKHFDYDFAPAKFYDQIDAIAKLGYRFVSMEDILSNRVTGSNNILITIDDGNRSVKAIYESVLDVYNIKPVLFIYPAITDRMFYAMTSVDLKRLVSKGATLGGHGYNHLFVNEKLYRNDLVSFEREVYKSKSAIEKKTGQVVSVFAYPFGSYSQITKEYMSKAGYKYAFSLLQKPLQVPLNQNSDPYNLPRFMVTKSSWPSIYSMLKKNAKPEREVRKRKEYENS